MEMLQQSDYVPVDGFHTPEWLSCIHIFKLLTDCVSGQLSLPVLIWTKQPLTLFTMNGAEKIAAELHGKYGT